VCVEVGAGACSTRGRRRMQNPRRGAVGFVGLVGSWGCVRVDVRARRTGSGRPRGVGWWQSRVRSCMGGRSRMQNPSAVPSARRDLCGWPGVACAWASARAGTSTSTSGDARAQRLGGFRPEPCSIGTCAAGPKKASRGALPAPVMARASAARAGGASYGSCRCRPVGGRSCRGRCGR
jgi:hypothetical protein